VCCKLSVVKLYDVAVDDEGENFDCASILSSHTQDVKCVRWHPSEEVSDL